MAPNYAEVHNNLALGYSNMGLPGEALESLYRAYLLHGHRRNDYYDQATSLLPLAPGSVPGLTLVFHHRVRGIDPSASGVRLDVQTGEIERTASFCFASIPGGKDSLSAPFIDILRSELSADIAELYSKVVEEAPVANIAGPWESGETGSLSPREMLQTINGQHVLMAFPGGCFPGQFPVDSAYYVHPSVVLMENGMEADLFQGVMDIYLLQLLIDRDIDGSYTLFMSRRFRDNVSGEAWKGSMPSATPLGKQNGAEKRSGHAMDVGKPSRGPLGHPPGPPALRFPESPVA